MTQNTSSVDKVLATNPLLKPVIANCTVSSEITIGEGGLLESVFKASCTAPQTMAVLDAIKNTPAGDMAKKSMQSLGIEEGRCGVDASVSTNGGISVKAVCPAP